MNIDNAILIIAVLAVQAIVCSAMFMSFPRRRGVLFTVCAIVFCVAIILAELCIRQSFDKTTFVLYGILYGLAYLPALLYLLEGYIFLKIFAFLFYFSTTRVIILFSESIGLFFAAKYGSEAAFLIGTAVLYSMLAIYLALLLKNKRFINEKLFVYDGRSTEWMLYAFGSVFALLILLTTHYVVEDNWHSISLQIFILCGFIAMCFASINSHEKIKQKYEIGFMRKFLSFGQDYYQKMHEMYERLSIMRHDYKYHLNILSELAKAGDVKDIKQYLEEVQKNAPENMLKRYCSNQVFNALLSSYEERAAKLGIEYSVQMALPETLSIPNYEMCVIFGNLLENAFEACKKLEHGKEIKFVVKMRNSSQLAIMVKNSFNGAVSKKNGELISSKKHGGLGLKSVEAIAANYGGHVLVEHDSSTFTVYVMLENK